MFYHGGMTLGYLTPPVKTEKTPVAAKPSSRVEIDDAKEQNRDRELSTAFLTPWHLFY